MSVVSIRKELGSEPKAAKKIVEATQKAIDALPLNSGEWRIDGYPGFWLRARASKKYRVLKKVNGKDVAYTLKAVTFKEAKAEYHDIWNNLEPKPAPGSVLLLGAAIESFLQRTRKTGPLAEKTQHMGRENVRRFLANKDGYKETKPVPQFYWVDRPLKDIPADPLSIRQLQEYITKHHGQSTSNQVQKLLQAVYNWHRKVDPTMTLAWPSGAAVIHDIPPRKWAFKKDEDLRAFWTDIQREKMPELDRAGKPVLNRRKKPMTTPTGPPILIDGEPVQIGVSTLGPLKKMYWIATLLTGGRNSSVREVARAEYNREKKTMHFLRNKGNPAYTVPVADVLVELLDRYLASSEIPTSPWLFPSPVKEGESLGHVKEVQELGVVSTHHLRHHFKTELTTIGATKEQSNLLTGHATDKRDVNAGYLSITPRVIESLRPLVNEVAERYLKVIPEIRDTTF